MSDDTAAWAQAWISGAAILASGAFAVWVPRHERKVASEAANLQRLAIDTEIFPPAGLTVLIRYRPEFWHVGHVCKVTLLEPGDTQLLSMRFALNSGQMVGGGHSRLEAAGPMVDRICPVRLVREVNDTLFGAVRLLPSALDIQSVVTKARLRFEIVTDDGKTLLKTEKTITATERVPDFAIQVDAPQTPGGGIYGIDNVARV